MFRVASFEEALKKRFAAKSLEGLTIPADGMNADIHGSAEYRAHLVGVMARRAVDAGEFEARKAATSKLAAVVERRICCLSASCPALCRASTSFVAW